MQRTTRTITFSLPPAMATQVRAVMRAEGRTMSDLVREAPVSYTHLTLPTKRIV